MALTLQDIRGTVDFAIVTVREDEFDAVLHAAVQALRPNTRSSTPLKDSELGKPVQLFKSPSDPIPTQFGDLRDSELYLMHPGLEDLIKAARHDYEVFHFAPGRSGISVDHPYQRHRECAARVTQAPSAGRHGNAARTATPSAAQGAGHSSCGSRPRFSRGGRSAPGARTSCSGAVE